MDRVGESLAVLTSYLQLNPRTRTPDSDADEATSATGGARAGSKSPALPSHLPSPRPYNAEVADYVPAASRTKAAPTQQHEYLQVHAQKSPRAEFCNAARTWRQKQLFDWLRAHRGAGEEPRKRLTPARREALEHAFHMMDIDGNGAIDATEMSITMRALNFTQAEITRAIRQADIDQSGALEFEEFCSMIATANAQSTRSRKERENDVFPPALLINQNRLTRIVDGYYERAQAQFASEGHGHVVPLAIVRERERESERRRAGNAAAGRRGPGRAAHGHARGMHRAPLPPPSAPPAPDGASPRRQIAFREDG